MAKDKVISFRPDPELADAIEKLARAWNTTEAYVVKFACREQFKDSLPQHHQVDMPQKDWRECQS